MVNYLQLIFSIVFFKKNIMAINPQLYLNGIRGLLSHFEINNLSRDYEGFKSFFHHATTLKEERDNRNN